MRNLGFGSVVCAALLATACGTATNESDDAVSSENAISTPSGQSVTFSIEGNFESFAGMSNDVLAYYVREQLKYALPQLHAKRGAVQLPPGSRIVFDRFEVTNGGSTDRIHYVAQLNGIWKGTLPAADETISVILPRTSYSLTRSEFNVCAPKLAGDPMRSSYFALNFDPKAEGCAFTPADAMPATVTVAPRVDAEWTSSKAPEYTKIWADEKLRVVVFFDKDKRTENWNDAASADEGIVAFRAHLTALDAKLGADGRTDVLYTPTFNTAVQNVVVTHKKTLADGREIIVESVLLDPAAVTSATSYPALAAGAPVDVVIKNASPFAPQSTDPSTNLVVMVTGSATPQHASLLVANARYSYELALPQNPTPGLSKFTNAIQFGGDVPYAVQADVTKKVIDALEEGTKSYDTLLGDIQGVNADLLPVVVGEHQNQ